MKRLHKILIVLISIVILSQIAISDIETIEVNEGDFIRIKVKALDEDGDPLIYSFSKPLNESGQWQTTYGDYGKYTINVTASDGKNQTTKELKIVVNKVNWPPILKEIRDVVISETDIVKINPKATDQEGDDITYKISNPIGNDGVWQTDYEDAGEYDVTVTASDQEHSVKEEFLLTVENLNRDPVIKYSSPNESDINIDEDEEIEFEVFADDLDGEKLSFLWLLDGKEVSADNNYEYYADYDSAGTHKVRVDVSDEETILRREWNIEVDNVNRAPVLDPIEDITVNENETVVVSFTASDPDEDDVRYSITEPIGDDKEWKTTFDDAGEYEIEVTVSDGKLIDTQIVKITVLDVDRAPVFKKVDEIAITEEEKLIIKLKAEDPDGDDVTFESDSLPYGASLDDNKFEFSPTYETVQKPESWFNSVLKALHLDNLFYKDYKDFVVTFVASGKEKSTAQDINIRVNHVNRAPLLLDIEDVAINETNIIKIKPRAIDYDNDRLKFTISDPIGNDGKWKTDFDDNGEYTITVTVSDGKLEDSKDFTVFVNNLNRQPEFEKIKSVKANEDELVLIKPVITDPDGDSVELSIDEPPAGAELEDGLLKWTPDFDTTVRDIDKDVVISFTATDRWGGVAKQDAVVTIKNVNRPPVVLNASPIKSSTAYLGVPSYFAAVPYDYDNDTLYYTWKLGVFERVKNAPLILKRTFTMEGPKTVKLLISDGESSITKEWKINAIPVPKIPRPRSVGNKLQFIIDNKFVQDAYIISDIEVSSGGHSVFVVDSGSTQTASDEVVVVAEGGQQTGTQVVVEVDNTQSQSSVVNEDVEVVTEAGTTGGTTSFTV